MISFKTIFSSLFLKFKSQSFSLKTPRFSHIALLALALLLLGGAKFIFDYLGQPLPKVILHTPKEREEVLSDDLYIRGSVYPLGSKVLANGQPVSLNGDGTFTAVLKIGEGQNVLKLTAEKSGKKAELLTLVTRKLSPEEAKAKAEKEAKEKAEAQAKILSQNQEIAQVQAAYTQKEAKQVRVAEHKVEDSYGVKRVVGRVVNDTDLPAYWVKVSASFVDQQGTVIDSKIAFVTSFEQFLKPGQDAPFETQTMEKPFDHYQLEVTWEKE